MMTYSVIIPEEIHIQLCRHLIRVDGHEDLCFATYVPSSGNSRKTAILTEVIYPLKGERKVHGNVGFNPSYLERVLKIASTKKEGVAFLHSHPSSGWQGMSNDDIIAENRLAPATAAVTDLPLVGLTLGMDEAWSARFWIKDAKLKRKYNRNWCETVRVLGTKLTVTYNDHLLSAKLDAKKQLRTISAWGNQTQEDISRLKIGIVGLGSVGSIVAEILARIGISRFVLIDFDSVELKNLDRLANVFLSNVGSAKIDVIEDAIRRSATSPNLKIYKSEYSICEKQGFEEALDCDVLFSCVDRPWPRQVLNFIAYAHLIPVIDGGILVRTNKKNTNIVGADWKAQTVGYKRPCLECIGQYTTENATLEKSGLLNDPEYIKGLDLNVYRDAHENVYAFSSHLASMEVLQLLTLFIASSGIDNVGQQMYHFVTGTMDSVHGKKCEDNCFFQSVIGRGDYSNVIVYGEHKVAEAARYARKVKPKLISMLKAKNRSKHSNRRL